jgi:dethiobiotin synthetase
MNWASRHDEEDTMVIVVAGTGTEVGKTWAGARLATALRDRSLTVQARKPAQSFEPDDPLEGTDAAQLGAATGEEPTTVCPAHRWYTIAMAPPMAADALGREPLVLGELADELAASWGDRAADVRMVELAGGIWSPIAHDGDCLDLTRVLAPDAIVLVADAGLGTINAIRPAVAALTSIAPVVTLLNRFDEGDELHRRNRDWLADRDGFEVVTSVDALADRLAG